MNPVNKRIMSLFNKKIIFLFSIYIIDRKKKVSYQLKIKLI